MTYLSKSTFRLGDLLHHLEVTLRGDPDCLISGVGTLKSALPGQITFLVNPLYKKFLTTTQASAVIILSKEAEECPAHVNAVITTDPYYVYSSVASFFDDAPKAMPGIHPSAVVGERCQIDDSASIGANCVIGNEVTIGAGVHIGANTVIGEKSEIGDYSQLSANVTLYHRIKIGKGVRILSGTVIGSDGFGMAKHKGNWFRVPQLGRVIIEDNVDIGANCAIDRGAIEDTVIAEGAKLDNLIQIAHNVQIGEKTALAACVGVSGSTVIGKNCLIGGSAGFAGHLTIADNVMITGGAAITKSIREPGIYSSGVGGVMSNLEWRKNSARVHRLEKLMQRVDELESRIKELTDSTTDDSK